jgi:rod shape-determining protein MreC
MQRRNSFVPFFLVFFSLSLVLILIGRFGILDGFTSILNKGTGPIKTSTLNIFGYQNKVIKAVSIENAKLKKEVSDRQTLILENKALKDQFAKSGSQSMDLLPARVIGFPGFVPGVSNPEYLIIDKGTNDGVKKGSAIIIENYLVGKVIIVTNDFSKVELLNNKRSSFTAKVTSMDGAEATGVIKGQTDEMNFENVLLTLSIKKEDLVLTKGDKNEKGEGYPPDLVIGKIVSVEKKSSDLFQKAKVVSFVDFKNLRTVFVLR